jgi:mannose-6-phosphate isomerase-like protein (cupin superfamily)
MEKVNLAEAFAQVTEAWRPMIAGDINDFQVKVVKLRGSFHWHCHAAEDELFLVISGSLRMRFRDRDVTVDPGEFVIVPHGVEHLPEAIGPECRVVLLEPRTTLNTGDQVNERTVANPERIAASRG